MWPRKKYWWETGPGGTPPLQNPTNTLPTDEDDPMWRIRRDIQHPDVRILPKAQSNPIKIYPNTGPPGWSPRASAQTTQYDHTMGAGAGSEKPTSMLKNPFGKMSPEELKDFQEVLKEMSLDMKPEFVGDLYRGEDKQYAYEPSIFSDATADEYKKRKQRYKYLA